MRVAKIFIEDEDRWVEIDNNNYYLLDCHIPTDVSTRVKILKENILENAKFANLFWGINVLGLGYNYKSLVGQRNQYNEPLFFLKSFNSVCAHKTQVIYPRYLDNVWVEVELVTIIGKKCHNVSTNQACEYIYGYTIGSDITAKNILNRDHHLACSKALDQFAPVGPSIITDLDTSNLDLATYINNRCTQRGNTSDRILNDAECVSMLSKFVTLMPGDLIFTGTPAGAMDSVVQPGDKVRHTVKNIGELLFSMV